MDSHELTGEELWGLQERSCAAFKSANIQDRSKSGRQS